MKSKNLKPLKHVFCVSFRGLHYSFCPRQRKFRYGNETITDVPPAVMEALQYFLKLQDMYAARSYFDRLKSANPHQCYAREM